MWPPSRFSMSGCRQHLLYCATSGCWLACRGQLHCSYACPARHSMVLARQNTENLRNIGSTSSRVPHLYWHLIPHMPGQQQSTVPTPMRCLQLCCLRLSQPLYQGLHNRTPKWKFWREFDGHDAAPACSRRMSVVLLTAPISLRQSAAFQAHLDVFFCHLLLLIARRLAERSMPV